MGHDYFDVTTVGEMLIRLSVPPGERLDTASRLDRFPAGAEGNVASLLARLGRRCAWIGALPDNSLGRFVTNYLRMAGVDLEGVAWQPASRIGIFYVEFAAPPRPINVIYDRTDSCAARLNREMIPWDHLLRTRLVHLTGITPALSPTCLEAMQGVITRAKAADVSISFDINYRQKLWEEAEAKAVLTPLIQGIELLFCSQTDAYRVFGYTGTPEQIVERMVEHSGARHVVVTLGAEGAIAWDGAQLRHVPAIPVQIMDRLGAGDAFAAGVIHGWLAGDVAQGLRYGVVLAALALSQVGDMVVTTSEEIEALLMNTSGNGELLR